MPLIVVAILAWWLIRGDGMPTVRQWIGQGTLEDQQARMSKFVAGNRIGSAGDVWLVKRTWGLWCCGRIDPAARRRVVAATARVC